MINGIVLEFYKLKRKYLFLMTTCFLFIELLWASSSINTYISRNPEHAKWELMILTISSLNCVFLPILSAICVSRICDMEHKGDTWKLLLTLSMNQKQMYFAKFFCSSIMLLFVSICQFLFIWAFGMYKGLENVPYELLFIFLLGTSLTCFTIIALQQWASMTLKNQAFSLTLGMIGAFLGLTSNFISSKFQTFIIWSYYMLLSPIKQLYLDEQVHFTIQNTNTLIPLFAILIVYGIVIYFGGQFHFSRKVVT